MSVTDAPSKIEPPAPAPVPPPARKPAGGMLRKCLESLAGDWLSETSGLLVSFVAHSALLIVLGLMGWAAAVQRDAISIEGQRIVAAPADLETTPTITLEHLGEAEASLQAPPQAAQTPDAPDIPSPLAGAAPEAAAPPPAPLLRDQFPRHVLLLETQGPVGGGYEGRTREARSRLVGERGGTPGSERAVELGLDWLAAHQRSDGSWRLNHHEGPCQGRCANPGSAGSSTGATGLALLPFLGAGHTARSGRHQDVVHKGIEYLRSRMLVTRHGGDLQEGSMYGQALATLALCENLAMTGDDDYRESAQQAVDFICTAQHPRGGWRYFPGQPGDMTVTGWQIMALKSAKLARLRVPSPVIEQAKLFLGSLESSEGAAYGYLKAGVEPGPTAVGLLCRMYTGWPQDDVRLQRGADYLAALGDSPNDLYFNYYATQVLHHHEGPQWPRWNQRLRERLIDEQKQEGHERGSWYYEDRHGKVGGRLYNTAMAVMILEVYYRHLPLYGKRSVQEDF